MAGNFKIFSEKLVLPVLCLFVFFLPIEQLYAVITIFLIAVLFVITRAYRNSISNLWKSKVLMISCAFYILHLIGMLYSSNAEYGWDDLQTKLVFLLFPLMIAGFKIDETIVRKTGIAFITGCCFSMIMFFFMSVQTYSTTHNIQAFFYKGLSHWFHPTYLSIYYSIALLFLLHELFKSRSRALQSGILLMSLILLSGILLLSSRTATASALLAIVVYPILHYGKKLLRPMALTGYVASIIAVVCLFFVAVHFNNRYEQVEHVIENYAPSTTIIADTTTAEENSTSARLHIWRYAAEAIQDNPVIGAGTGDVRDELESVFNKHNYSFGLKHHLNAHNQFLHTGIALGLVGMLFLLSLFIAGFISAFRERNFVYLLFLLIIFLNCLTESLLERQVGILCFCFFNSLYAVLLIRRSKDIKIPSL